KPPRCAYCRLDDERAVHHLRDDKIFIFRVLVVSTAADDHTRDSMTPKDVTVCAAAHRVWVRRHAQAFQHREQQQRSRVIRFQAVPRITEMEAVLDARLWVAPAHIGKVVFRVRNEALDLLELHAPHFAVDAAVVRHGVDDEAALDFPDISGGLEIYPALRQAEHCFCRDRNRRHAFLWLEARVGRPAVHLGGVAVGIRRSTLDAGRRPAAIDHHSDGGRNTAVVHVRRTDQPDLFATADRYLYRPGLRVVV